ncbi:MAG: hypothetical protein K0S33_545 [Bacteroidetes bacterium]|jgi:hypothetical protein|nr:hypothetical protein [Bacteroidota bacterium]
MFEFPYEENASVYTIYITYDSILQPKEKDFIIKKQEKFPVSLIKDLRLGKNYKWYVETTLKSGKKTKSDYHYFSIATTRMVNRKLYQPIQLYNKKEKIQDGLIWCDQYRCAVDRKGNVVWFMTEDHLEQVNAKVVRDFRLYNDGNISFIHQPNASRVDIDMNVLWQAPAAGTISGAKKEDYHHALLQLPNGNYMVLGNEKVKFANENPGDTVTSEEVDFCNIIEFNEKREIVWSWRMKDYFPYEYLINSKIETRSGVVNPHANSFCVDETNNVIYLSFRDISRIIKIDRKSKKILASYGQRLNDEDDVMETDLFRLQHDIQLLPNGDMLLFNNNDIDNGKISCVEIIRLPATKKDTFQLKWKFDLNYDAQSNGKIDRMGGVKIMPDGNYLICEGSSNRVVEISPKGELLWDFALRQKDTSGRVNDKFALYRANFSRSLYPNYVTFYPTSKNELIVLNKGLETDIYTINIYDADNKVVFSTLSPEIKRNNSIKIKTPLINLKNLRIELVSSNTKLSKSNK